MNGDLENPESSSGKFLQTVRPVRDLESNWTVDLAKNLEEYLLKICSGQITGEEEAIFSVNFAEAALLLQGSVQVYSRKVEYLYSLVLHTLNFISQKSQENQEADPSARSDSGAHGAKDEGEDPFWVLEDIPVEAKNLLDGGTGRDTPRHFVRPPANLVVLEGECLDAGSGSGELESYLLATSDLYRDFILLDSCDAISVNNFIGSKAGKGPSNVYRGSSVKSKGNKTFQSPSRQSGGTAQRSSAKKKKDANLLQSPCVEQRFESNDCNIGSSYPPPFDFPADGNDGFGMGDDHSEPGDFNDFDDDDDDDPWKPLNPHAPGNLKVKPHKKVKHKRRLDVGSKKHQSLTAEFPLPRLDGPISTELTEIWEARVTGGNSQSHSRYEKLRQSLILGERKMKDAFNSPRGNNEDNGYDSEDPDIGPPDFDFPDNNSVNDNTFNPPEDVPQYQEKFEDPEVDANLEDLCRSHLDALLATLAENEKQTELATRVSTWKQRIEQNLEEQEARPPFDIHKYGERVLSKLSTEVDGGNASFTDVVKGQEKHDVARTFSALLQLVNNGDIDLVINDPHMTPICHSHVKPFYVRLLKNEKKKGVLLQSARKRAKSPLVKGSAKGKSTTGKENCPEENSSPTRSNLSYKFSMNLGKASRARCTPDGKKRRKSRTIAPLNMHFVE